MNWFFNKKSAEVEEARKEADKSTKEAKSELNDKFARMHALMASTLVELSEVAPRIEHQNKQTKTVKAKGQ